jgi:hypothetical protein
VRVPKPTKAAIIAAAFGRKQGVAKALKDHKLNNSQRLFTNKLNNATISSLNNATIDTNSTPSKLVGGTKHTLPNRKRENRYPNSSLRIIMPHRENNYTNRSTIPSNTSFKFKTTKPTTSVPTDNSLPLPRLIIRTHGEKLFQREMVLKYAKELEGVATVILLHHHACHRKCYYTLEHTREEIRVLAETTSNLEAITYDEVEVQVEVHVEVQVLVLVQ